MTTDPQRFELTTVVASQARRVSTMGLKSYSALSGT